MADINLKTETPDTSLPTTGFLFGADSQAAASPSVFTTQAVATTLLGSTTLSGATITADAPVLNMSQTWNNGAVTFTGLKFNATDTASAAASLLLDLQIDNVSRFSVRKAGGILLPSGSLSAPAIQFGTSNTMAMANFGGNNIQIGAVGGPAQFQIASGQLNVTNAFQIGATVTTPDTILTRRAAANLRFGAADAAAPVAQTLSVQSVVAGTTNTAGANLTITGSQGTGTGAGGSIVFQVAPAGSSGTAQNALATALTISDAGQFTFTRIGSTAAPYGTLATFQHGSNAWLTGLAYGGNGYAVFASSYVQIGAPGSNQGYGISLAAGTPFGWTSSTNGPNTTLDVILTRDAANTLALRNGTNAQAFNIYNTFTDASNYERLATYWAGNTAYILSASAGTGVARNLVVGTALSSTLAFWTAAVERWQINTSGHFLAGADNTYDIGASGATRPRSVYAGTSITPGRGVTVAGLPTPSTGMIARVTDATAPVIGATVAGGGAAYALVNYNGANWTVIGV